MGKIVKVLTTRNVPKDKYTSRCRHPDCYAQPFTDDDLEIHEAWWGSHIHNTGHTVEIEENET